MNEGDDPGIGVFLQRVFQGVRIDRFSPCPFHDDRGGLASFHVFDHATTEYAVSAYDDFVSRCYHVHETAFHAYGARTGDRVGQLVVCLEGVA